MAEKRYEIDRLNSIILNQDTPAVESNCKVITFFNAGDTPVVIEVVGGIKRRLVQYQQATFGTDWPGVEERNKFNITFEALVTTRELHVERARYVEISDC